MEIFNLPVDTKSAPPERPRAREGDSSVKVEHFGADAVQGVQRGDHVFQLVLFAANLQHDDAVV